MHTSKTPNGLTYIHNGDFSGKVLLQIAVMEPAELVEVDFADLKAIIGQALLQEKINQLEQADPCAYLDELVE